MKSIGAGDLFAAVLSSTGYAKWYKSTHPFCNCNWRQEIGNYIKFLGPEGLSSWIKDNIEEEK